MTSGSGEGDLAAAERRRGRALDEDVDELAGGARAREVHGRVPSRPAPHERRARTARSLDEDLLDATDALGVPLAGDALHDVHQTLQALVLDLVGDLVGQLGGFRARARREDEGVRALVAHLLD